MFIELRTLIFELLNFVFHNQLKRWLNVLCGVPTSARKVEAQETDNKLIMPYPTLVLPPLAFPSSSLPPLPPLVNYFHSSQQCIPLGIAPSPTNNRSEVICSRPSFILVFSSSFQSPPPQSAERRVAIHFSPEKIRWITPTLIHSKGLNGLIRLLYPLNVICLKFLCSAVAN